MAALANNKALLKFRLYEEDKLGVRMPSDPYVWSVHHKDLDLKREKQQQFESYGLCNEKGPNLREKWLGQLTSKLSSRYWRSIQSLEKGTCAIAPL